MVLKTTNLYLYCDGSSIYQKYNSITSEKKKNYTFLEKSTVLSLKNYKPHILNSLESFIYRKKYL